MRKDFRGTLGVVVAGLILAGCGPDEISTTPEPPAPRFILAVHGNQQEVIASSVVQEPLMARVVDAAWQGVPNVAVRWVADPGARLLSYPDRHALYDPVMVTDRYGHVAVYVQAIREGSIKVVASVVAEHSTAEFEIIGITPNRRTIFFGPYLECSDQSMFWGAPPGNFEVFVGAPVIFVLEKTDWGATCSGRLVSVQVPEGGDAFASDTLFSGSSFRFTPNVPGTWVFRDVINGGEGRMTARVP